LLAFINRLQNILPNIKITYNYSQFEVEFLDLVISKGFAHTDGTCSLRYRTHQKPLNKYLYIPFTSHHHPSMFKSFIYAEMLRYVVTCTDETWFNCMRAKFTHRLLQRGYPAGFVEAIARRVSYSKRDLYLKGPPARNTNPLVLAVPYAHLVKELNPQWLLRFAYNSSDPALHAKLPHRPIVALKKTRNLNSLLVKAGD